MAEPVIGSSGNLWRASTLESLGKLAALLGVLLPVTGALDREIAFLLSGRVPPGVGVSLSVPELAVLGSAVMLPGVLAGLLFAWALRGGAFRLDASHAPGVRGMRPLLLALYLVSLFALAVGVSVVLISLLHAASAGISSFLSLVVTVGIILWSARLPATTTAVPVARLIPVVLAVTVVTALGTAIGPTTAGTLVARVSFASDAGMAEGVYSVLGGDDSATWLLSCDAGSSPVRVQTSLIDTLTVQPFGPDPPVKTLDQTLASGLGPGFVQRCP
jgi:hypothetical protein